MPDDEHVVVQFRPRRLAELPGPPIPANDSKPHAPNPPDHRSPCEPARDQTDDFRHRMLANAAAFAFTIALAVVGLWLAKNIADLRNAQDCALTGLRDCGHISTPQR
jgi:hypothetical protein